MAKAPRRPAGYSGTPLAKKLGITEGNTVLAIGAPPEFRPLLEPLPAKVTFARSVGPKVDVAHVFTASADELARRLTALRQTLRPDATVWVSWPKKAAKVPTDVTENVIRDLALLFRVGVVGHGRTEQIGPQEGLVERVHERREPRREHGRERRARGKVLERNERRVLFARHP